MNKQGAIAVALMASLIGQPAAAQGDGQLVLEPKSCQSSRMMNKLKQQPNQGPCARVVIEQVDGNYITISFLARGSERGSSNSLSLGGTTATPLNCRLNKCRLSQPLKLELDNAKEVAYDSEGVENSLPSAWPAVGSCQLSPEAVSCSARSMFKANWSAQATF